MFFSVVIPSYNRERVIVRAINSVLGQTIQDFEIIVVDDGSKDNTENVVKSINDNRIKYVRQDNAGACVARNTGIVHSQGLYVSFLDSDDEWFPQMLEKQLEVYQSDKEIGCVYSNLQVVDSKGDVHSFGKQFGAKGNCYSEVLRQGYMAPTTVLSAKRECFDIVGCFDVTLPASQDDDMCFKLAKDYKVGYIDEIMADMYVGQMNRISVNKKRVADGWWMLWRKYESDVISLCGYETICKHYLQCMKRYAEIDDKEAYENVFKRFEECGGTLSIHERIKMIMRGRLYGVFRNCFFLITS